MYIYADVLILFNFIINNVIFMLTAWAVGVRSRWWRICLAALLGSVYSLLEIVPALSYLYSPLVKIIVSILLIIVAFGYNSIAKTALLAASFYLVSFLLGGAVLGWLFFAHERFSVISGAEPLINPAWYDVAFGILLGSATLIFIFKRLLSRADQRRSLYTALLVYEGRQSKFTALLDTGNSLHSTIGGRPVILIDYAVVVKILSPAVKELLMSLQPDEWLANLPACRDENWLNRVEVIPYRGVGTTNILLGFRPDNLVIVTPNEVFETSEVVVAIYNGTLSPSGRYSALLNYGIFRTSQLKREASACA